MIYLDNAATTPVIPEVLELVVKYMTVQYGNTASLHRSGLEAERALKSARGLMAKHLGCKPDQLTFTSGGTEGNNWIIQRLLSGEPGHALVSAVEHASVLEAAKAMKHRGWEITYIPVNAKGTIDIEKALATLRPNTKLVSVMLVNNELGTIQPVSMLAQALRQKGYRGPIHTDATQALGKLPLNLQSLGVDYLSASAHKCHGPKGVGFVYQSSSKALEPLFYGGGHEDNRRSGTHNLPGIVGMAKAIALADSQMSFKWQHAYQLREQLLRGIETLDGARVLSGGVHSTCYDPQRAHGGDTFVPQIIALAFKDLQAEVLLHTLEQANIMVSSGSACSSAKRTTHSHVLEAIGLDSDYIGGVIRISTSSINQPSEIETLLEVLRREVPKLQATKESFYRRGRKE